MNITKETSSYNERRYGRPWIAKVDFSKNGGKPDYQWGDWAGDHYNGGEGILSIDADPGDIIADGQKDNRQHKNSAPTFYVVTPDGGLECLGDKGDAYKYYLANKDATPDRAALEAEREKLLERISEIDKILED